MRKMLTRLGLAALIALALAVPVIPAQPSLSVAPAEAHDSSAALVCNATQNVATHITPAGNLYALDANVCVGHYNTISGCCWTVEGMVRYTCWRNADPWDGCRANGNVELHSAPDGAFGEWSVQVSTAFTRPPTPPSWPCSGESCWFSNSGRISSAHDLDGNWEMQRAKQEGGTARFLLADGTNVVEAITDTYTGECYCYN